MIDIMCQIIMSKNKIGDYFFKYLLISIPPPASNASGAPKIATVPAIVPTVAVAAGAIVAPVAIAAAILRKSFLVNFCLLNQESALESFERQLSSESPY